MKTPILGASYVARSINAANDRCVNLFPEVVAEGGKEPAFLQRAPGLKPITLTVGGSPTATLDNGPIRGLHVYGGKLYVVTVESPATLPYPETKLWEVDSTYAATLRGTVSSDVGTGQVTMADNGTQLFLACGDAAGTSYIYNNSTTAFAEITDPDFPGAVTVGYLDGYFVFNEPNSQRFWITSLLDGFQVDPLDFASAEGSPDDVVSLIVDHRELWLFGENSVEVWYNSGDIDFPLSRIQGAYNEIGCIAPYSVAKMDNSVFWLGADARGTGIVYRADGYQGIRISTHAVEFAIQQYEDPSDALAYTYQQDGHTFYVLIFPSANATWVFDASTNSWHERAGFDNGNFTRHWSNCHTNFLNTPTVGDYIDGSLYTFDLTEFKDDGAVQKWLRSWRALPTGENNLKRTAHHTLQIDMESGVGLISGQGSDPQIMLRWSDDGGHTWSNYHQATIGKIGEYYFRVFYRRLGMTLKLRDRVYELSGTDPVKIAIMGAELTISGTNA